MQIFKGVTSSDQNSGLRIQKSESSRVHHSSLIAHHFRKFVTRTLLQQCQAENNYLPLATVLFERHG